MTNEPGWPITRKYNYLPPSIITARSTSTRLPWEGSPRPSRPPPVSPSEGSSISETLGEIQSTAPTSDGSSTSEGPGGTQSTATLSNGSSMSEGPVGIQSTATPSDGSSMSEGPTGIQSTATPGDGSSMSEGSEGIQSIAPAIASGMKIIFENYFVQKFKTRPR